MSKRACYKAQKFRNESNGGMESKDTRNCFHDCSGPDHTTGRNIQDLIQEVGECMQSSVEMHCEFCGLGDFKQLNLIDTLPKYFLFLLVLSF